MSSNEEVPETEVRSGINMTILFFIVLRLKLGQGNDFLDLNWQPVTYAVWVKIAARQPALCPDYTLVITSL